jgi:hypothetical protein
MWGVVGLIRISPRFIEFPRHGASLHKNGNGLQDWLLPNAQMARELTRLLERKVTSKKHIGWKNIS